MPAPDPEALATAAARLTCPHPGRPCTSCAADVAAFHDGTGYQHGTAAALAEAFGWHTSTLAELGGQPGGDGR